jgi:4-hydroxy-tetrahydrodipicolinate synthase
MTPETVERLSRIPAVCALKDAVNDVAHTVRCWELCGDRIVISDPLEEHLLVTTLHFDQQVLLGTTPVFLMQSPQCQPIQQYWELARAGKGAEAAKLFYELQPLRSIWTEMYQVLWNKDGALHPLPFIKHWMDQMGMRAGPVRPPMTNLTAAEKARFNDRLAASGWMERLVPGWPAST